MLYSSFYFADGSLWREKVLARSHLVRTTVCTSISFSKHEDENKDVLWNFI